MTRQQQTILWIGLFLVIVYLFTDVNVRNLFFNRGSQKSPATTSSFTVFSGSPASTGNGQSNSGNAPSIQGNVGIPTPQGQVAVLCHYG